MIDEIEEILQYFKKIIKTKTISSESGKNNKSLEDRNLEKNLRIILQKYFNLSIYGDKLLSTNKEFRFYQMDLFHGQNKELYATKYFGDDEVYFSIKMEKTNDAEKKNVCFLIFHNDLSKLYYYDFIKKKGTIVRALEESQLISNEATKFYFTEEKEEANAINVQETFINDIKLDLISNKAISFIGENNDIPAEYLQNYFVKGCLISDLQ